MIEIHVFDNAEGVAQAGAAVFLDEYEKAIALKGEFVVGLSGGSTPKRMHALLVGLEIEWSLVTVVLGDERYVPPEDPQSNERMVRETLVDHVPVGSFLPMYRGESPEADARSYEEVLPFVDLIYLGLGDDAHTASLFPGELGVFDDDHKVIAAKAPVNAPDRITLTANCITCFPKVAFLVAGESKAEAAWRCLEGPVDIANVPSQAIARFAPNVVWLTDRLAVTKLQAGA
ncbi:6-phosphogluconolactonase [bacterium]|nr:MAG: 6-phosphogluconolactonase [bacterium]